MLSIKQILEIEIGRNFSYESLVISYNRGNHPSFMDVYFQYIQNDGSGNIGTMSTYFNIDLDFGNEFQRLFDYIKYNQHWTEKLTTSVRRNEILEMVLS